MTPEQEFNFDMFWVLEKIKKESLFRVPVDIKKDLLFGIAESAPLHHIQLKTLDKLKALDTILLEYRSFSQSEALAMHPMIIAEKNWERDRCIYITPLQPKFNQFYKQIKDANQKRVENKDSIDSDHKLLFSKNNKKLWRQPQEKYCWEIEGKGSLDMLSYFLENRDFILKKILADKLSITAEAVVSATQRINLRVKSKLEIKMINKKGIDNRFIQGKSGRGYRINFDYFIVDEVD